MANRFLGKVARKTVKFMDEDIEIRKLAINQVLIVQKVTKEAERASHEMQQRAKAAEAAGKVFDEEDNSGITILLAVIKAGAPELAEMAESDLKDFSMEDLSDLSSSIMEFSGLNPKAPPVEPA